MKFFNTLSSKIEEFKPMNPSEVTMYTCGPTVYDSVHIGNLRAYVFVDLLKRALIAEGYGVKHVMNITDVDDKTIRKSDGKRDKIKSLTKKYEDKFWQDFDESNNIRPDVVTRATEYVEKMIVFIEELIKKGFAYKATDGSVYFSIAKFTDYGKLAKLDLSELKSGARVAQDDYTKENPADFVLWKAWDEKDGEIFWDSSLGKGRPGWHVECSVMSTDVLGPTIDIHAGGIDLVFPHHENEIAQSEAKSGQKFVNFWVHNEHLLVSGQKMSKSLSNFYTLDDIREKGFSALDFRYYALGAHYRSKMNYTWEGIEGAKNARERLMRLVAGMKSHNGKVIQKYLSQFNEKIFDDLNVPEALAILWELVRDAEIQPENKLTTILEMDKVLGLNLGKKQEPEVIPAEIIKLADERKQARNDKKFGRSDEIREEMLEKGWRVEDLANNNYKIVKA
ncbi:MAG: cysteine--tRNA ligase [Patescibacteria group bacterium]